jgi:hypothetical protein
MGVGKSKLKSKLSKLSKSPSKPKCGRVPYGYSHCILACAYTSEGASLAGIESDVLATLTFDESDGPHEASTLAKIQSGAAHLLDPSRLEWMTEYGYFPAPPGQRERQSSVSSHPALRVASEVATETGYAVLVYLDPVVLVVYPDLPLSVLSAARVDDVVLWARESIPTYADADPDASVVVTLRCEADTAEIKRIKAIKIVHRERYMVPKKPPVRTPYIRQGLAKPETLVW